MLTMTEKHLLKRIDVRLLARRGVLSGSVGLSLRWKDWPSASSVFVLLAERNGADISLSTGFENLSERMTHHIPLDTTPCYFGGFRHWFLCPSCKRRVAILYLESSFGCRNCKDVTYTSKKVNRRSPFYPYLKAIALAEKIDELAPQVRRQNYSGFPTKKWRILARLQREYMAYAVSL